jgi:alpha-N-arabinofuranosidase
VRKELAWGVLDNNQVGTDEWVQLNRAIGSDNVICINLGTGTLDDARYWVEYCNSEEGTSFADLRAKYGNPQPYGIKYWCLGNEVDGEPWILGYKNAEDYCKFARETAKVMRKTDPGISFIANGSSNYGPDMKWVEWNWKVINEFRDIADYISLHRYWEYSSDYYVYMGQHAMDLEEKISIPASQIKAVRDIYKIERPISISFDEWAPHGWGLLSNLVVAQFFNAFIRHADMVKMANYTLLTSLLGRDLEGRTFRTPLFYTFKMFSTICHGMSLDVHVECDTFNTSGYYQGIPYLDVSAVYSEEMHLVIVNVVNRHRDEYIETEIISIAGGFKGKAKVKEIYSEDLQERYTYEKRGEYIPVPQEIPTRNTEFTHLFRPHSFTQIIVEIDK